MSRFDRNPFDFSAWQAAPSEEAKNRLLAYWWFDDGEPGKPARLSDRLRFIGSLQGRPTSFPSRAPRQDDPAPPLTEPAPQGFRPVWLLSDWRDVRQALKDTQDFRNLPYAALGGASFLLGLDPGPDKNGNDWHARQKALVSAALGHYRPTELRLLARRCVREAALTRLTEPDFDLAILAEQAALRYLGLLWGFGFQDHAWLESASRSTYRALQYLAVGQHFVTEPATLPTARRALGQLVDRCSALMDEYEQLARAPRRYGPAPARDWPVGVQPWSEAGLTALGQPLLKRLPSLSGADIDLLSGRDRATVVATLLAGTAGNLVSAVCLLVHALLQGKESDRRAVAGLQGDALEKVLEARLATLPPTPVLPRRTRSGGPVSLASGGAIPPDTDCLVLLEGLQGCPHTARVDPCPRVWGEVSPPGAAGHGCLGRALSLPLVAELVALIIDPRKTPGLALALDPLTGDAMGLERLWGFGCTRHPLRFEREKVRVQRNLIVAMRVKQPIADHAGRLRQLIAGAVPRIESALAGFGGVHFAWFEFSDDDTLLVLRTIYDGPFEAYIKHFAVNVGDLFDGLFEHLEGAPPRPVAEHPDAFVDTIRRYNRTPLAGYLFSAYPGVKASEVPGKGAP